MKVIICTLLNYSAVQNPVQQTLYPAFIVIVFVFFYFTTTEHAGMRAFSYV